MEETKAYTYLIIHVSTSNERCLMANLQVIYFATMHGSNALRAAPTSG